MKKRSIVWNFFHKDPEDKTKTICQICFKVLLYSGSNGCMRNHLRQHKVLQEDDEEIPCSECGKILPNKAALKRHEKTVHFDTDRFVCSYCPKAFSSNHTRLIHERIHTGEKPHQVPCLIHKTCRFLKCENVKILKKWKPYSIFSVKSVAPISEWSISLPPTCGCTQGRCRIRAPSVCRGLSTRLAETVTSVDWT